jgi:hypothetical protein
LSENGTHPSKAGNFRCEWDVWSACTRVLREVNEREQLRDEQFRFRPKHSKTLQLARLFERLYRNFDERWLTGVVFLVVAKAFDTSTS